MSVKLYLSGLSDHDKKHIDRTLTITCENEDVDIFDVVKEPSGRSVLLPFSFARSFMSQPNNDHIDALPTLMPLPNGGKLTSTLNPSSPSVDFTGTLRPHQQQVRDAAIKSLSETGSIVISAEPGFGKTITSIEMICTINVPTVIFVKQAMIMDQWLEAITKYVPSKKVAKITSNKALDPDADVYLMNPIILKKPINETRFIPSDFQHIKLVVVDELHQIVTKVLHRAFFKFQPDYLIGLSATPYRPKMDPFEPAIAWFFGSKVVGSKLFRKHTVYCVKTGFKPKTRIQQHTGKLDWSSVLTSQAEDVNRNQIIVDVVCRFPERTWLILVKRVEHAKTLQTLFSKVGVDSETIVGTSREFDKSAKILIGTTPKIGVGFDHTPIDALCMAADVLEYFEQFLGRCMRRQDVVPIVIDFEDQFNPLLNHLKSRVQKYKEHGGEVNMLSLKTNEIIEPKKNNPPPKKNNPPPKKTSIKIPQRRKPSH
jgi:superfamily II DNA or RNA helicase